MRATPLTCVTGHASARFGTEQPVLEEAVGSARAVQRRRHLSVGRFRKPAEVCCIAVP